MYQFDQQYQLYDNEETSIRNRGEPFLEIVEQPQSRGFRFRYECEGPTHGGLRGEQHSKDKKTFPEIRIRNYKGQARVMISLATDESQPKNHVHKLIGPKCKNGVYVLEMPSNKMSAQLTDLVILHATKRKTAGILLERIVEAMRAEKMLTANDEIYDLSAEEMERAKKIAEDQAKVMQLNVVRLCFQAYLMDNNDQYTRVLPCVYSNPVYDSKSPGAAVLKICRMDRHAGSCAGGDEVFLLCDKVQRDDIAVRFYQLDENGDLQWEGYGDFGPADVHRQYAIVFRTPKYPYPITEPIAVQVQLKRHKDGEMSDAKPFTYFPQANDQEEIERKKRKRLQGFDDNMYGGMSGGDGGPGQGQGGGGGYYDGSSAYIPTVVTDTFGDSTSRGVERVPIYLPSATMAQASSYYTPVTVTYRHRGMNDRAASSEGVMQRDAATPASPKVKDTATPPSPHRTSKVMDSVPQHATCDSGVGLDTQSTSIAAESDDASLVSGLGQLSLGNGGAAGQGQGRSSAAAPADVVRRDLQYTQCLAERLLRAVWLYASSGNVAFLLMVQRHLLKLQNSDGDSVLHESVICGQLGALKELLAVLATTTDKTAIGQSNNLKQTPLHLAAVTNRADMISVLLEHGCPVDAVDQRGNTAVHIAARDGFVQSLEAMLEAGGEDLARIFNRANFDGLTPLHLAVMNEREECVRLLVSCGADRNAEDKLTGRRPLHYAVATGNLVIIGLLRGASVNAPAYDGSTALHVAVNLNKLNVAALLMSMGADADVENYAMVDSEDDSDSDDDDGDTEVTVTRVSRTVDNNDDTEGRLLKGYTPRMLASDSLPMLRILGGEVEPSVVLQAPHSDPSQNLITRHNIKGDLFVLQERVRRSLAEALDKNNAWERLASLLRLTTLVTSYATDASPTYKLLGDYQSLNGTVARLRECLKEMGRDDCLRIIDAAVKR